MAYKALVEKKLRHQIQRLKKDRGEYIRNTFTNYYTTKGIQMKHIVPHTPLPNGVVEKNNHTFKEMTNFMIQAKGLSLQFWVEDINCANYIVNHTPNKYLKFIAPKEAWSNINRDFIHFCVFGSEACTHILDENGNHYNLRVKKCIFVGYYKYARGYRILQPK